MNHFPTRRQMLTGIMASLAGGLSGKGAAFVTTPFQLATFSVEVTPPLGHPCMGGGIAPVQRIDDPLFANGLVFLGLDKPVVFLAVDWCEIRNDAYDRWRTVLAEAGRTEPGRVMLSCVHQHDAPIADLEAQRILEKAHAKGSICDLEFHERTVQRVGKAVAKALSSPTPVTHVGTGQAKVEKVASNRRYLGPDGKPRFDRMSATRAAEIRDQPEETVDPWLKTLSFWNGDRCLAALSCYATHPMSHYGKGGVSSDFVGLARRRRQSDDPAVLQIYASGCSGNVTAGKYNDGSPDNRPVLADRIYQAMAAAWKTTRKQPIQQVRFRSVPLRLEPRNSSGFTIADLEKRLQTDPKPFGQCLAALGLSWRKRADAGRRLDLPMLDFGPAQLVLLPGESYVEFQLAAQKLRPDSFVVVAGYGECATGYVPVDRAFAEGDGNLTDWCWVAPGSEKAVMAALQAVLEKK